MKTKKIRFTLLSVLSLAVLLFTAFALFFALNKKSTTAYADGASENKGSVGVTLTDGIVVNYRLPKAEYASASVPVATFVGSQNTIGTTEVTGVEENDHWKFVYKAITPQYLFEDFSIQIGGTTYVSNYSIADYCRAIKTNEALYSSRFEMDKTVALVDDLLYYGEMAKAYLDSNYTPDPSVTAGTEYDTSNADGMTLSRSTSANGYKFTEAKVVFDYLPALRFYLNTAEGVTVTINGKAAQVTATGNGGYVTYRHIYAVDFGTQVKVELQEAGETVQTLYYSINDYVARIAKKSTNSAMTNLAKALYCYGESAKTVYELPAYVCNGDGTHKVPLPVDSLVDEYAKSAVPTVSTVSLETETEIDWTPVDGTNFVRGLTTDGANIYGVSVSYEGSTTVRVVRYNLASKAFVCSKTLAFASDDNVKEPTAGITYYNGDLIIYPKTGSPWSIPASFDENTDFAEYSGFNGFGLSGITDVVYNQKQNKFAVKTQADASKIYIYNGTTMQKESDFSTSGVRISGTDNYIYSMPDSPTVTVYDWSGNQVVQFNLNQAWESDTNVQGILALNDALYYTRVCWSNTNSNKFTLRKAACTGTEDCTDSYIPFDEYYTQYKDASAKVVTSSEIGWDEHTLPEGDFMRGMATDGKYIFSVAFSGSTARIMRYNPTTQKMVYSQLFNVTLSQNTAGITWYDGKIIIYPTDGNPMCLPADFDKNSTLSAYTGFDAFKVKGSIITDVSYNATLDRFVVQYTTNTGTNGYKTTSIFGSDGTFIAPLEGETAALRMIADNSYIYMVVSNDHFAPGTTVYDWDGNRLLLRGADVFTYEAADLGRDSLSDTNVQGVVSVNGVVYISVITWNNGSKYTLLKQKARAYNAPDFKDYFTQTGTELTLETTQEKALSKPSDSISIAKGITTDGTNIYILAHGFAGNGNVQIVKYNPQMNAVLKTSKLIDLGMTEEQAGITYYDGKIIVYPPNGKPMYIPADFDETTDFAEYTDFAAFGNDIRDVYYDATAKRFAVRTSTNTVTIFNENLQEVSSFSAVSDGLRMSGDGDYLYIIQKDKARPVVSIYEWNGAWVRDLTIDNSSELMGMSEAFDGVNTQGIVMVNGVMYTLVIHYNWPNGYALLKTQVKSSATADFISGNCYYCGGK